MNENVKMAAGAGARLVEHARAGRAQALDGGRQVRHAQRDVVQARAALLEKLRDRRIRRGRLRAARCADRPAGSMATLHLFAARPSRARRPSGRAARRTRAPRRWRARRCRDGRCARRRRQSVAAGLSRRTARWRPAVPRRPRLSVATVRTMRRRAASGEAEHGLQFALQRGRRPGWSALLMTKTSAISMMPALIACTSSPMPGTSTTTVTCARRGDLHFVLPHADGFDEDEVPARGVQQARQVRRWRAPGRRASRAWPWSG